MYFERAKGDKASKFAVVPLSDRKDSQSATCGNISARPSSSEICVTQSACSESIRSEPFRPPLKYETTFAADNGNIFERSVK